MNTLKNTEILIFSGGYFISPLLAYRIIAWLTESDTEEGSSSSGAGSVGEGVGGGGAGGW